MAGDEATAQAMTPEQAAVVQANLETAFDFLEAAFDDPGLFDGIPTGATVIPMPQGNPQVADANLALARQEARRGKDVYLLTGLGDPPAWVLHKMGLLTPPWAQPGEIDPRKAVIRYDQETDVFMIDAAGGSRKVLDLPTDRDHAHLLIDAETHVVLGFRIEQFLARAAYESPDLLRLLAYAEIRVAVPEVVARARDQGMPALSHQIEAAVINQMVARTT